MGLQDTPSANRLHIGIFGKRNSGKSSLINALTGQDIAIVSDIAGTTTDPVQKAMEVRGVGPCVFIDTAGFDDEGELGKLRIQKTIELVKKTDIAILLFNDIDIAKESEWFKLLKSESIPVIGVIGKTDIKTYEELSQTEAEIKKSCKLSPIFASAKTGDGIDLILLEIMRCLPPDYETKSITGHLVKKNDVVMLVMPQDSEAPKGRLILPQVQTIRDLLDNGCIPVCVTKDTMEQALSRLNAPPELIVTDSQVFAFAYEKAPKQSRLTSFSILMAGAKGDISSYIEGANAIDTLTDTSRVLIAEACTHAPLSEDIGRVKIPAMLKKKFGDCIKIDIVSGVDFPKDLTPYSLIIHCGGCMFNRRYLMSRIFDAKAQNVPITNYGILLAKLNSILDKVVF